MASAEPVALVVSMYQYSQYSRVQPQSGFADGYGLPTTNFRPKFAFRTDLKCFILAGKSKSTIIIKLITLRPILYAFLTGFSFPSDLNQQPGFQVKSFTHCSNVIRQKLSGKSGFTAHVSFPQLIFTGSSLSPFLFSIWQYFLLSLLATHKHNRTTPIVKFYFI